MGITAASLLFHKVGANKFQMEKNNPLGFHKIKILPLFSLVPLSFELLRGR